MNSFIHMASRCIIPFLFRILKVVDPTLLRSVKNMSESKVEFKWLEAKCNGTDTVVFRLEDGAVVKVKVDIDRAGVAAKFSNPDGTPHYEIGTSLKITVIPPKKSYYVPRSQLKIPAPKESQDLPFIR
jgi:hypothetical protein